MSKPLFDQETLARLAEAGRNIQAAFQKAGRELEASLRRARLHHQLVRDSLSPEQIERLAEGRYHRRIASERRIGLAYVRSEGQRVSRELGLRPETDPRNRKEH